MKRKYGKFGMLIMPAHLLMLIVLPYFFLFTLAGTLSMALFSSIDYLSIGFVVLYCLVIISSRKVQAFVKAQIALIIATSIMLKGIETQKFERLLSTRPEEDT
jgi:hypothetical protein